MKTKNSEISERCAARSAAAAWRPAPWRRVTRVARAPVVALCLCVLLPSAALSHPDVFMESQISFVFDGESVKAVSVDFALEKFFAQRAWAQADSDRDGHLSPFELELCEDLLRFGSGAMQNMVFLWIGDQRYNPEKPPEFTLVQTNRTLGATLTIPLDLPLGDTTQRVAVCVYDDSCFVRIMPAEKDSVRLVGEQSVEATVHPPEPCGAIEIEATGPMNPVYKMTDPMQIVLDVRRRPASAVGSVNPGTPPGESRVVSFAPTAGKSLTGRILDGQKNAKDWLADLNEEYRDKGSFRAFALMLVAAFVFGVLHAAGPGHGKTVVASYLVARKGTLRSALVLGVLLPFVHSGSGVAVAVGVQTLVDFASRGRATISASMIGELLSYSLVLALGIGLLIVTLRDWLRPDVTAHADPELPSRIRSPVALAFVVGIFPCPTTIIIMEIFLPQGALAAGLWVVFFQAVGMATTIASLCCLVALGTRWTSKVLGQNRRFARTAYAALTVCALLLVICFGALFLWGGLVRYGIGPFGR